MQARSVGKLDSLMSVAGTWRGTDKGVQQKKKMMMKTVAVYGI